MKNCHRLFNGYDEIEALVGTVSPLRITQRFCFVCTLFSKNRHRINIMNVSQRDLNCSSR